MPKEIHKGITSRPPVVVIMGHIDHGKSTLLDYIRKSNIVEKEAGGITQHISAYEVTHPDEKGVVRTITFLDTPGHEAFQAMRKRGASVGDIAILVVSAEDGVKPQTLEALAAITESKTPYIVAINKIDKPGANIERTKQTLLEAGIYIEGYGGSIPSVPLSAKTGEGVKELLDMIILVTDLETFTGEKGKSAEGVVIESSLDTKKGIAATLIIKSGTLSQGEFVVAGESFAPVRIMENFLGQKIESATFSSPIRIIGFSALPKAGDTFVTVGSKKEAEVLVTKAKEKPGNEERGAPQAAGIAVIPIIIKGDVLGSTEALVHELKKIETETVKLKIVDEGAGAITENDVKQLSGTPGGIILGFAVKCDPRALELAERQSVSIQTFDIIYKLSEWMAKVITERTPKMEVEEVQGTLKVLKLFNKNKNTQVIGGSVQTGKIGVGDSFKILRRGAEVGRGKIEELQSQKIKTREVTEGNECGVQVESKIEIAGGDVLESFSVIIK